MGAVLSGGKIRVYSPSSGLLVNSLEISSLDSIDKPSYPSKWSALSTYDRVRYIRFMRKAISKQSEDFISIIMEETGKKEFEALMEVFVAIEHLRSIERKGPKYIKSESRSTGLLKNKRSRVYYEPYGIAGAISPWNYPLILALCPAIEAMVSGNSVVLKPSEHTPGTTQLIKKIWDKSTGYSDALVPVYGGPEIGRAMVQSSNINIICFTGSTEIGRKIAADCGALLKPCILELGGKDPMIILNDADIDRTVDAAVWGAMSNAGQTCISVERILVQDSVYDTFLDRFKDKVSKLSAGPNSNDHVGAITVPSGIEKIKLHTDKFSEQNKFFGVISDNSVSGSYCKPTIIIDPDDSATILNEETFGPVVTIERFNDDSDAVFRANMTRFGLAASIFGRNKIRMKKIARQINAGSVSFNDIQTHYGIADIPFGGVKDSGLGRLHGKEGVRSFCYIKTITDNRIQLNTEPWWYGNQSRSIDWIRRIIRSIYS